jgi:hypothetical protein
MKYYKGDIVQKNFDDNLDMYWGVELIGVNENIDTDKYYLWYRPLKNYFKQSLESLLKLFSNGAYDDIF